MSHETPISVPEICDRLGRAEIARRMGVRPTAVSNAVADERFPSRWFDVIEGMCRDEGVPCPRGLFNFVPASGDAA